MNSLRIVIVSVAVCIYSKLFICHVKKLYFEPIVLARERLVLTNVAYFLTRWRIQK
jgi:hypothetical protein